MIAALWATLAAAADLPVQVYQRGSREPVAAVEVWLGDVRMATTDADGRAVLALDTSSSAGELRFSSPDFKELRIALSGLPASPLRVYLEPVDPPYEVVVESFRPTSHTSRHHLDAETARETPGTFDDPVRLVQALPGVTVQREYSPTAGDLSVRASSAGDNRYYLDGIELPYLYHFNQYASVYPTSQIDSLELYSSTFGASYGDSIGGIIEARSKREHPKAVHGTVHMNFLMAGADLTVPVKNWTLTASARRSYQDLSGSSSAQYTLWPVFHDYSVRASTKDWSFFVFGAGDSYERATAELDLLDAVAAENTPSFRWKRGFTAYGLDRQFTGRIKGRAVAAWVDDRRHGELSSGGKEDLHTGYLSSRLDLSSTVARGGRGTTRRPILDALRIPYAIGWNAGWEIRAENTQLTATDAGPERILVAREAPALARGAVVDASSRRVRAAVYAEGKIHLGTLPGYLGEPIKLRIFPGIRIRTDSSGAPIDHETRIAVRWHLLPSLEAKFSAGRYVQTVDTEFQLANPSQWLPDTRSWQAAGGLEARVADRLEFELNGWYKDITDLALYPPSQPIRIIHKGEAYGFEASSRYRIREHFFASAWLGSTTSRADDGGVRIPTSGDQPLFAGFVSSYSPSKKWTFGARYRYGAGLPYTPVAGSLYDANRDAWIPIQGDVNGARLPDYQKVDAHVTRTWVGQRATFDLTAEVGWVPKSAAALYPTWNYDWTEQGWVIGPTLLPILSARARF